MNQLDQYFTTDFLQDFDPVDRIKREIIDEETGEILQVMYDVEGVNVTSRYIKPNIEEFKELVFANKVIDPLLWIVKIHFTIGIEYKKYLYVKAQHCILTGNKNNYKKVMQLWKQFGE